MKKNEAGEQGAEPLMNTDEHFALMEKQVHHGCLFIAGYIILLYLVFIAFFWLLGSITHSSTKNLTKLHDAQTATEIRDQLDARFGHFDFRSAAKKAQDTAAAKAEQVTNQAVDAATGAATNAVNQATDAAVNQATDAAKQQIQSTTDQVTNTVDQSQP